MHRSTAHRVQPRRLLVVALFVLGLFGALIAGTVVVETPGVMPTQRNWIVGDLDSDHTYGQTFALEHGPLESVALLLLPSYGDQRDDPVTLRVWLTDVPVVTLAEVTLAVRDLATDGPTTFRFDTPVRLNNSPYQPTPTLYLEVAAPTLTPGDGVVVIGGPNTYAGGLAVVGDQPNGDVDLAFQARYRQPWLDQIWPVSQFAAGKPGILGWPAFYSVLAYSYVAFLLWSVQRWWHPGGVFKR